MKYISTRGAAPALTFSQTVMTGLARDGGLYLPEFFPSFTPAQLRALRGRSYADIAKTILWPFAEGDIEQDAFYKIIDKAYQTFRHPATCPLVQTRHNEFILELFHGPTLAFKDVAMQFLSRLMDYILQKEARRATIIGATSGDTGGAAIEAFAGRSCADIFILFPKGRVSKVQQRQMTSNHSTNVHALAIEGNFDDCQALVKALFNDHSFRDHMAISGVNSINWARIMAQIVYYVSAALSLGAPDRAVSFTVPTGNFGDIFAGFVASKMGLPIARLVIATNDNDILARTLESGIYETRAMVYTTSPSMDIQLSSNFERLLFEASGRDWAFVCEKMLELQTNGCFCLGAEQLSTIRGLFAAGRSTMEETAHLTRILYKESGYLADPHTAVAVKVARAQQEEDVPMVILSTAHPAKFPEAVQSATGLYPDLPPGFEGLFQHEEKYTILANDEKALKNFIMAKVCLETNQKG